MPGRRQWSELNGEDASVNRVGRNPLIAEARRLSPHSPLHASTRLQFNGERMTPQEQLILDDFLQRLAAVNGTVKDPQADALIRQRLAGQPDALYLLVQRSLLQQHALDAAKAQITQLQAQVANQQGGASFLGNSSSSWSNTPPPMPQQAPPTWRERLFGSGSTYAAPQSAAPGFLQSAATTAAGVAGGMFLFDGLENLLGGHHSGGFFGGQPDVIENVTENNFFDGNNGNNGMSGGGEDFSPSDFADDSLSNNFDDDSSWS
jgi:uncharacterized protein